MSAANQRARARAHTHKAHTQQPIARSPQVRSTNLQRPARIRMVSQALVNLLFGADERDPIHGCHDGLLHGLAHDERLHHICQLDAA